MNGNNKWQWPEKPAVFNGSGEEFVRQILVNRGIDNEADQTQFLEPDYHNSLHDPFLLKDMEKAVTRLRQAITDNESIAIFADYDADGIPAAAILASFFRQIGFDNYTVYIPDRYLEAYGLSQAWVRKMSEAGHSLVVTVDCGITSFKEVKLAGDLGVDVIITDHHLPPKKLPPAVAVVDPYREGDNYPFKHLAGAGVAFKLITALLKENRYGLPSGWEKWLLDLVAIATIGDMMPLVDENRILVKYGLVVMEKTRRSGLQQLLKRLSLPISHLTAEDIAFMVAPRINSASRMAHGRQAYDLLMAQDKDLALVLVSTLESNNLQRKKQVEEILDQVRQLWLLENKNKSLPGVLVAGKPDWNPGVLGLAASKLVEEYDRPIFLWSYNGQGEVKGSCRSDGRVNLVDLMSRMDSDSFLDFGGHAGAGGFALAEKEIPLLAENLNLAMSKCKVDVNNGQKIAIDGCLFLTDITWSLFDKLDQLAPFGQENPRPVFEFKKVTVVGQRRFGQTGNHLELVLEQNGKKIKVISFFYTAVAPAIGEVIDCLGTIEKSVFGGGRPELRLRLVDWQIAV
ncbi:MAG: single-stranded-DNA-specific exonuclease RecJ [Patescibacteria group bacterium]